MPVALVQPLFKPAQQPRQRYHDDEVRQRYHHQGIECVEGVVTDQVARSRQILHGHIAGHGGLLQQGDHLVADGGQDVLHGLGQDHMDGGLDPGHAQGPARLHLARVHRADAAAHQLGHIRAGVDAEGDDAHGNASADAAGRLHNDEVENQQQHHHGDAADDGGVDVAQRTQGLHGAASLAAVFDDGHQRADDDADAQGAQGDDGGVAQAVHQHHIAVIL